MSETTSPDTEERTDAPDAAQTSPVNPYAAPQDAPASAPASAANGFSIASLVLGIASIPTGW